MSSDRPPWLFRVRHMLDAIAESRAFVAGMDLAAFAADPRTAKAVVWNIALIGEAARHVPPDVAAAHPEIPWAAMRGMRNHVVHGYDRIDHQTVWEVVQRELPPLVAPLEAVLREHEP